MGRNNDDRFWSVTRVLRTSTNNYHTCKIVVCKRNVSFTIFLPIYSSLIETVEHVYYLFLPTLLDCLDGEILIDERICKKKKNRSFLIHRSLDTIDGSPYDRLVK